MNFIDLFAGAGGLSEGFLKQGYEAVAHIEMNSDAAQTLKTRACYHYLKRENNLVPYYLYLSGRITRDALYNLVPDEILNSIINAKISEETIHAIFEQVDGLLSQNPNWNNEVDIVIGGPPCQAYSLVGRAIKSAQDRLLNEEERQVDPRNFLYKLYCRFLIKYTPKMFVFENVPGLLTAENGKYFRNMKAYLKRVGYVIEPREINAKNFGVLQNRRRIIIIGWRKGTNHHFPEFIPVEHGYIVNDILRDLPELQAGQENNRYRRIQPSHYLAEYGIRNNEDVLTWHVARSHIDRDKEIYRRVIQAWNNDHQRLRYPVLPEGLRTHNNLSSFLDRFKIVEGDTPACHTMMAHLSKDGHYFIHPDIHQARSITVREAARIQSFPDNYYFEGSRTAAFTQIGNAVPPLLSEAIARQLLLQLEE
jgi:DNA (cytosine-5)-methyltransferase 1